MDLTTLEYIKSINGTIGKTSMDSFRDEMIEQYNTANKNVITEFSVLINSDKAKNVLINDTPSRVLIKYNKKEIQMKSFVNGVKPGDYVSYDDEMSGYRHIYLCVGLPQRIRDYDYHLVKECNNSISLSFTSNPIPCVVAGESYGVKLNNTTQFDLNVDTKVKIEVAENSNTKKIKPDHRIIFNNSEHGIYKIGDITTYKQGVLAFTCQKDKYMKGYDDLENNLAYNGVMEPSEPSEPPKEIVYSILGEDNIVLNKTQTYTLEPSSGVVSWAISDNTVAEIVENNYYSVTIKALKGDDYFELIANIDGQEIKKDVFTSKR